LNLHVVLTLLRRELRSGAGGLRIVLACLALGVTAIAAVGSVRAAIVGGLANDGRRVLGGDLEIAGGSQPLPDPLRQWLIARGARVSDVLQTRSMVIAPNGERQLVELKAVDGAWPLVGQAAFAPVGTVGQVLGAQEGGFGLAVEPIVLDRLKIAPGAIVRLGNVTLPVRAAITTEPDRVASPSLLGPRVLISAAALPATGLIQPGALVQYDLRVLLPDGADPNAVIAAIRAAFPNQGWRMRTAHDAVPGVIRFIDQTSLFMTLVGLTSLLVGGIGVANGVRAWLTARTRTIATLRCLGASGQTVFLLCLAQVMVLSACGVAAGLVLGAVLPLVGLRLLSAWLPVPPEIGIFPGALALAGLYGLVTAACFALWPVGRAMRIPGAALFRDSLLPEHVRPPPALIGANIVLAAILVALTITTGPDPRFAAGFCVASVGALLVFRLGGSGLMALARAVPRLPTAWARLGVANLYRPGSATPLMLASVGLGLTTLASVTMIEGNVRREITEQLPSAAPSFFFIDIQDDQLAAFERLVRAQKGVQDLQQVPNMRARVVALAGVPVEQVHVTPATAWALQGDRGLTYADRPPEGTKLVAGAWWPADYTGKPLVSLDAGLAAGWHLKLGDTITVNLLGRDIDLTIASLRDIAWRSMSLNYAMVTSPGLLSHAPHSHIATVRVADAEQGALLRVVTDAMPNVSGIRVSDVLASIATLLQQVAAALTATGSLTLAAGALVLAGAVASGQGRRTQEAVILKSLGATRRQIRAAWLVEFGVLGAAAGLIAALVGSLASFAVVHFVMDAEWVFLRTPLAATILSCIVLMLAFGYAGTATALRTKVAPLLRND
jgi:putative ABC transport system permease protein